MYTCAAHATTQSQIIDHKGVLCDECQVWFHRPISCQNIHFREHHIYANFDSSSIVWARINCSSKNYSRLIDYTGLTINTNSYDELCQSTARIDTIDEITIPTHQSFPQVSKPKRQKCEPLRLFNVNCQPLSSKFWAWRNLLDSSKPDINIATKTRLNKDIADAELEMGNYTVYRRDRETGIHGGFLVAISKALDTTRVPLKSDSKILWVNFILKGQPIFWWGHCTIPTWVTQSSSLRSPVRWMGFWWNHIKTIYSVETLTSLDGTGTSFSLNQRYPNSDSMKTLWHSPTPMVSPN